jgi:insertion element IS1 protein InsB
MSGIWRQSSTQEGRQYAKIKSKYITWHTRIRRLVRQTVYCSKTQRMHDVELGLFINEDELRVAV